MNGRRLCQLALALVAATASGVALADRGGFHRGGFHHTHVGVGVVIGPGFGFGYPYGYPYGFPYPYYYPGYYPPAVVAAPVSAPEYIEQGPDGPVSAPRPNDAAPASQAWWYHCDRPSGYYPYVQACPGGWQKVPAQPPANS